jgi:hypothetical protein
MVGFFLTLFCCTKSSDSTKKEKETKSPLCFVSESTVASGKSVVGFAD